MSLTADEFRSLLERLRSGSEDAVSELLEEYGAQVLRVIRRRLNQSLRSKFDSQDFSQAVWKSFFENRAEIASFKTPQDLAKFLQAIAAKKVLGEFRRFHGTEKHDLSREELSVDENDDRLPRSRQPTPSHVVANREEWERLNQNQPTQYRRLLKMRGEGVAYAEIAEKLQLDEKTVRRVIKRLTERASQ